MACAAQSASSPNTVRTAILATTATAKFEALVSGADAVLMTLSGWLAVWLADWLLLGSSGAQLHGRGGSWVAMGREQVLTKNGKVGVETCVGRE